MPTAAHFFAGIVVGLLLYQTSQKQFTVYHIMIFSVQSVVGPDVAWLFRDLSWSVTMFIHSAFGFAVCAFVLAIPFRYIGRALVFPIRYSDIYKITVAAGMAHIFIDALGHLWNPSSWILDPFYLFSYDIVAYFLYTPTGNFILIGAVGAYTLVIGVTYHNYAKESARHRTASLVQTINAVYAFPVVVGSLLLLRVMPFGDINGFFIPDAILSTNAGGPIDAIWIYITPIVAFVAIILAAKKAPRLVLPIGFGFAGVIFIVLAIVPTAGGGEGDLGVTYYLLLFIALPALLLGTSYHYDKPPLPETKILAEKSI